VQALVVFVVGVFRAPIALPLEIVARRQLTGYRRSSRRPRVRPGDRIFWSWLARQWARGQAVLTFVQPATLIGGQRRRFREHGARLSRKEAGRRRISPELRGLIREIPRPNPRWGAPRLLKVLFVLSVLAHHRRKVVHFNVTDHPSAQWTGQQLVEAFPWEPQYLLRDRDAVSGNGFQQRVAHLGGTGARIWRWAWLAR
jgi:putative transposase